MPSRKLALGAVLLGASCCSGCLGVQQKTVTKLPAKATATVKPKPKAASAPTVTALTPSASGTESSGVSSGIAPVPINPPPHPFNTPYVEVTSEPYRPQT